MKVVVTSIALLLALSTVSLAEAAVKIDPALEKDYVYVSDTTDLDGVNFLMTEEGAGPTQAADKKEIKTPAQKPQCFVTGRSMVNCVH